MAATNKSVATGSSSPMSHAAMITLIQTLQSAQVDQLLNTGAIAIKASSSALAKFVNTIYALCNGVLVKKTAADLPALVGTVVNATFNVFCFYVDSAGTVTAARGTAGATIGAVSFPTTPANAAMIGFIIINPTGTGNFVGGTTALDDATVVPTAVYINTVGDFNPNALTL